MTEYEDVVQDIVQETLVAHPELDREWVEEQCRDFIRREKEERESLIRDFTQYILNSLQLVRLPGIELPEVANLEEFDRTLGQIRHIEGMTATETSILLSSRKTR